MYIDAYIGILPLLSTVRSLRALDLSPARQSLNARLSGAARRYASAIYKKTNMYIYMYIYRDILFAVRSLRLSRVRMYMYIYVYVYVYMCIYIHIHILI